MSTRWREPRVTEFDLERRRFCRQALSGGAAALLASTVLVACSNPRDARLRARENRAVAELVRAVHRETSARIRSIACSGPLERRVCRVSFRGGRPQERWRLGHTHGSGRVQWLRVS